MAERIAARKRRKTGNHTLHYLLLLLVAGGILAVLSFTVFFPIEQILVEGVTRYAPEDLVETAGIAQGQNLLRVSRKKTLAVLMEEYPYIEEVKLRRRIPGTLVLEIVEAVPAGACETPLGYLVVGQTGRVLEIGAQVPPPGVMVVSGMYFYDPKPGRVLGTGYKAAESEQAELEQESFTMLAYLADAVAQTNFEHITMVDFSDRLNMMLVYDNRIMIELGSEADLVYKLSFAKRLIASELESDFHGVLDASLAADSRKVWSDPGDISAELEARRLRVAETESGASSVPSGPDPTKPEFAVIPGSGSSSSGSSSSADGSSSAASSAESSSSQSSSTLGYTPEELAVIPGSGSSSKTESSSQEGTP